MRAYLINSKLRTIDEVDYDGTAAGLVSLFPYSAMNCTVINNGEDALMYNPAGMQDGTFEMEKGWQIRCHCGCGLHIQYAGVCLIFGTLRGNMDLPQDPAYSVRMYREELQWTAEKETEVTGGVQRPRRTIALTDVDDLLSYMLGSEGNTLN